MKHAESSSPASGRRARTGGAAFAGNRLRAPSLAVTVLATAWTTCAVADEVTVRLFDFAEGNTELLEGILSEDDIRMVSQGATAPGLDFKVIMANPDLGLGHRWAIAQLFTDQTCNAQGECEIHVLHSSPTGWVTVAEASSVDVTWIDDGSAPATLLFSGLQGPAIWRWNGKAYAFDRMGDDDLLDAYYAATGGDNY